MLHPHASNTVALTYPQRVPFSLPSPLLQAGLMDSLLASGRGGGEGAQRLPQRHRKRPRRKAPLDAGATGVQAQGPQAAAPPAAQEPAPAGTAGLEAEGEAGWDDETQAPEEEGWLPGSPAGLHPFGFLAPLASPSPRLPQRGPFGFPAFQEQLGSQGWPSEQLLEGGLQPWPQEAGPGQPAWPGLGEREAEAGAHALGGRQAGRQGVVHQGAVEQQGQREGSQLGKEGEAEGEGEEDLDPSASAWLHELRVMERMGYVADVEALYSTPAAAAGLVGMVVEAVLHRRYI